MNTSLPDPMKTLATVYLAHMAVEKVPEPEKPWKRQ
jgi:hypothetical protein